MEAEEAPLRECRTETHMGEPLRKPPPEERLSNIPMMYNLHLYRSHALKRRVFPDLVCRSSLGDAFSFRSRPSSVQVNFGGVVV